MGAISEAFVAGLLLNEWTRWCYPQISSDSNIPVVGVPQFRYSWDLSAVQGLRDRCLLVFQPGGPSYDPCFCSCLAPQHTSEYIDWLTWNEVDLIFHFTAEDFAHLFTIRSSAELSIHCPQVVYIRKANQCVTSAIPTTFHKSLTACCSVRFPTTYASKTHVDILYCLITLFVGDAIYPRRDKI